MKKLLAIVLAISMLLSMVTMASAEEAETTAPAEVEATTAAQEIATEEFNLSEAPSEAEPPANTMALQATYSGTCGDNLTWTLDTSTGVLSITGTGAMWDWESTQNLPWCSLRSSIKSICFPAGITAIGKNAFYSCAYITSITVPDSVTTIGKLAFGYCTRLETLAIGRGVASIDSGIAMYCNSLRNITCSSPNFCVRNGMLLTADGTRILAYALAWPSSVCTIPKTVTTIDGFTFRGCNNVQRFAVESENGSFCVDAAGVLFDHNKSTLYSYPCGSTLTNYVIPDGVATMRDAFCGAEKLVSISAPLSVTFLTNNCFQNCSALESIKLSASITGCYDRVFSGCSALKDVYYEGTPSMWKNVRMGVDGNEPLLQATIHYAIQDGTYTGTSGETIQWSINTLSGVLNITGVGEMMGYDHFGGPWCRYSSAIKNVNIGEGITSVSHYAFLRCANCTEINLPNTIKTVAYDSISGCTKLSYTTYGNGRYLGNSSNRYLVLMKTNSNAITNLAVHPSTKVLAEYSCYAMPNLKSVSLPSNLQAIGDRAFQSCTGLTSIAIPDSVTSIGRNAFYKCNLVYNTYDNAKYLGNSRNPYLCLMSVVSTSISNCTINPNTKVIGYGAFDDCSSLTSITIPDSVTSIGYTAFCGCSSLTSITIPNSVTTIGNYAFYNCSSLTSITIPNSVTTIGRYAFYKCSSLTSITIPDSVTSIGDYAFYDCSSLTCVTIGSSVTAIGSEAFYNCQRLTDISVTADNKKYSSQDGVLFNKDKTILMKYPSSKSYPAL